MWAYYYWDVIVSGTFDEFILIILTHPKDCLSPFPICISLLSQWKPQLSTAMYLLNGSILKCTQNHFRIAKPKHISTANPQSRVQDLFVVLVFIRRCEVQYYLQYFVLVLSFPFVWLCHPFNAYRVRVIYLCWHSV